MARRDSNIDPFNAGEPILPWQDPDAEVYDDTDAPYEAPRYGSEDSGPCSEDESAPSRKASSRTKPSAMRERKRSAAAQKRESARRQCAQSKKGGRGGAVFRSALKAFATTWIIAVALSVGVNVISCTTDFDDHESAPVETDPPTSETLLGLDPETDSHEDLCLQLARARMDHLMLPGSPERTAVADRITTSFAQHIEDDFGRAPEQLGIDPTIVADWTIDSLIYTENDAYAFPDAEEPYASVYLDVEACSMMTMYYEFQSDLYDYLRKQGLSILAIEQGHELSEAQKTDIAGILQAAMVETGSRESSMCVRLTPQDGSWTIDESEFERYCSYVFGLPE